MRPGPPKMLEALVGLLIPPACREEVLGDLHERYSSPQQYIADALSTASFVILSQIRRTADPQMLLMQFCAVYVSFLAAAWRFEGVQALYERGGLLRMAIPSGVTLVALTLRDAYSGTGKRSTLSPILDASLCVAFTIASQVALSAVNRDWSIPGWILFSGGGLSVLLVSALRILFPPGVSRLQGVPARRGGAAIPDEDMDRKARKFARKARRSHLALLAGVLVVALFGVIAVSGQSVADRVVGGGILATALYVVYQLYKRRPGRAVPPEGLPGAYRAELERRRNALDHIWSWYLGPVFGALIAFPLQFPLAHPDLPGQWLRVAPFLILAFIWSISLWMLTQREVRRLQKKIDRLDDAERERD